MLPENVSTLYDYYLTVLAELDEQKQKALDPTLGLIGAAEIRGNIQALKKVRTQLELLMERIDEI